MSLTELLLTALTFVISVFILISFTADAYQFQQNSPDYARVYDLDTAKEGWEYDYYLRWMIPLVFAVITFTIVALRFAKPESKLVRSLNYVVMITWPFLPLLGLLLPGS